MSDLRVRFCSPNADIVVTEELKPSQSHDPFSRVGVSMNCSCAVYNAEWLPRPKIALIVGLGDENVAACSSGTAVCLASATTSLGASVSPGLSIWRYRKPR